MPNHIQNELTLFDTPLDRVSSLIASADRVIDFGVLVPLPIYFWPGSVGSRHEEAFPGTHLDAARGMWGTKWNAYEAAVREEGSNAILTFQTAWSPPMGWIMGLFNTLRGRMQNIWLDEGTDRAVVDTFNYGAIRGIGGRDDWSRTAADDETNRRMYLLYWGKTPEEMEADE